MYRSPNVVRMIKFKRLRYTGHVARMKESCNAFKILTGKLTRKRLPEKCGLGWEKNMMGMIWKNNCDLFLKCTNL